MLITYKGGVKKEDYLRRGILVSTNLNHSARMEDLQNGGIKKEETLVRKLDPKGKL